MPAQSCIVVVTHPAVIGCDNTVDVALLFVVIGAVGGFASVTHRRGSSLTHAAETTPPQPLATNGCCCRRYHNVNDNARSTFI